MADRQRSSKLALALSGGGFTGYLFEIGALTAFDDLFDDGFTVNDFHLYVGVSAGAAVAALLANGVKPEEIFEANLSGKQPYYFERRDIFAPAMGEGLKTVLRVGQQLVPLLKLYLQNRHEMSLIDLLDKAQDALPSGVYTLEPFARYLESTFAAKGLSNTFDGLGKELYIPAIDLETGQSVIFGDEGWRFVPISRAITASSAAPIYFCPVRIEGRDYIDAGIGRITFFDVAIQKGADLLVIVNPLVCLQYDTAAGWIRTRSRRPPRMRDLGFLSIGDQASRINLEARFSQALRLFEHEYPDKEFFVISPKSTETLLFERSFLSFRDRVHLLRCGYLTVAELVMERFPQIRARFARNGISISLVRIKERIRTRVEQLDGAGVVPSLHPSSCQRRAGWSSAF
ncbi:MAG: patatin-like phospholipase family protein [Nitrospirae bacterium]|nr:patatin-like phospholipase family protein [Nitrospirota bacterium]